MKSHRLFPILALAGVLVLMGLEILGAHRIPSLCWGPAALRYVPRPAEFLFLGLSVLFLLPMAAERVAMRAASWWNVVSDSRARRARLWVPLLGISAFYHDSAACLLRDGEIVAAAQQERFSRLKHDHEFPHDAITYCLKAAGITVDELDHVVFYDKPLLKFGRLLET